MTMLTIPLPSDPIRSGFLLIDASNLDDETFAEVLPMLHCTPATLIQSEQLMPRLIDVAALSAAQQDGLSDVLLRELNGERPPVVCAWLDCALDAKALARHLTRFLVGPGMDGAAVFWRYFDPRVFSLAVRVFSTEQTEALLGPITEWRFPWCKRWWSVSGPGREVDLLLGITPAWPSENQWRSLEHSALVARVLAKLQDQCEPGEPMTDAACLRLQRGIDAAMLDAKQRLHLSDNDDLMEYALHCMNYGEEFFRHPKLADAWPALAQGRINWGTLIALLDQNDYRLLNEYSELQALSIGNA